jgi:hypothetical protein
MRERESEKDAMVLVFERKKEKEKKQRESERIRQSGTLLEPATTYFSLLPFKPPEMKTERELKKDTHTRPTTVYWTDLYLFSLLYKLVPVAGDGRAGKIMCLSCTGLVPPSWRRVLVVASSLAWTIRTSLAS